MIAGILELQVFADMSRLYSDMQRMQQITGQATGAASVSMAQLKKATQDAAAEEKMRASIFSQGLQETKRLLGLVSDAAGETSRAFSGLKIDKKAFDIPKESYAALQSWQEKAAYAVGAGAAAGWETAKSAWASFKEWMETKVVIFGVALAVGVAAATAGAVYAAFKTVGFAIGLLTGESYKSANIDALVAMNKEVKLLQDNLPLTAVGASALNEALKVQGTSATEYVATLAAVNNASRTNGDELDRLGVKYKDQQGNLLGTRAALLSAAGVLATYKEGWDRTQAATAIGMGTEKQIQTALAVTAEKTAAAKDSLISYGLVIGEGTQEAAKKYEDAMQAFNREADLTSQGFKKAIADNIMPILTMFAEFFRDGFPGAVNAFRYSMATVASLFFGLKTVVYMVAESIVGSISSIGSVLGGLATAAGRALKGDFSGATDALVAGWVEAKNRLGGIGDNIVAQARANSKAMALAWGADNLGANGAADTRATAGKPWVPLPPKKPAGATAADDNAAFNDAINAQIEALKKFQALKESIAKQTVDRVTSENKRGMLTELDFINQVAVAEKFAMNAAITTLEQEKSLAAQKKNSLKEVAAIEGQIASAKEKLNARELAQGYAVLELEFKIQAARQAFYNTADHANIAQLDALRDKNKATREEIEEIGLTANQLSALTQARQNHVIALQAEKVSILEKQNAEIRDEQDRAANIADIDIEIAKLNELQTARDLSVQRQDKKQLSLELKGYDATAAQLESLANITGKMGDGWKKATAGLSGFSNAFKNLATLEKNTALSADKRTQAQVGGYAEMAGAAKQFFDEGTAGYEVLTIAEQTFRAIQLAMSIAAMVQNATEGTTGIAQSLANAAASTIAGVAKAFEQMGVWGFVGAAAILAFMASMGGSSSGGGGGGGANADGTFTGTGNEITATGRVTSSMGSRPSGTDGESSAAQAQNEAIEESYRSADAANKLADSLRKSTAGMTQLETDLQNVKTATQGAGRAQYEMATSGMGGAELAAYNYNAALKGQIQVLLDVANGTSNASDNMKKLANDAVNLTIDLKRAQGDIAGANQDQMLLDTVGYTEQEVAMYNHNQTLKDQIASYSASSSAADDARQAEEELGRTRYEVSGRLNVLLGRQTQIQFDRATELAGATDATVIAMLNEIYAIEDLTAARDESFATLERSIAAERKFAEVRLKGATDLQSALKTAFNAVNPALSVATARTQLSMFSALARSGGALPSAEAIRPALDVLSKVTTDTYKTAFDYYRDQARTANDISDLTGYADKQVSVEQQTVDRLDLQLETAKNQLDAMNGVNTSVMGVTAAVAAFEASMLAISSARSGAAAYSFAAPAASSGGGGGGGGGGGYGGGAAGDPAYAAAIAGMDSDIVAAYKGYYGRAPDRAGHDSFIQSGLVGDPLMQAILRASAASRGADYDYAMSQGYNPDDPMANYVRSKKTASGGSAAGESYASFAVGINNVPYDMDARIHKDERIMPAADNRELFARLSEPRENNAALVAAIKELTQKVARLEAAASATAANTGSMERTLTNLTEQNGGDAMTVVVQV